MILLYLTIYIFPSTSMLLRERETFEDLSAPARGGQAALAPLSVSL